ncbi:MAG: sigma factor-like helix-turn-helix DNA-binding protein [Nitrospinota bacterium]
MGKIMGLSKERIRQIEDKALGQLFKAAKARQLEAFLS